MRILEKGVDDSAVSADSVMAVYEAIQADAAEAAELLVLYSSRMMLRTHTVAITEIWQFSFQAP